MRRFQSKKSAILLGILFGLVSVPVVLYIQTMISWERHGHWRTKTEIGARGGNPYVKAQVAIGGLFALTRKESIYFVAHEVNGSLLTANCRYSIKGKDIDTRWWSLTVYGMDYHLIPNEYYRYSYNDRNVEMDDEGHFEIMVGPPPEKAKLEEINWIPTHGKETLYLLLRVYNPPAPLRNDMQAATLPTITEMECS